MQLNNQFYCTIIPVIVWIYANIFALSCIDIRAVGNPITTSYSDFDTYVFAALPDFFSRLQGKQPVNQNYSGKRLNITSNPTLIIF